MANDITYRITGDATSFKSAMSQVEAATAATTGKVNAASRSVESLGAKLSSVGSAMTLGITAPAAALGVAVVKTAADMEALKAGLGAVTKESGSLETQLARLKEVAKLPGLGLKEAIQGSTALQAAGFSAQLAERSLKAFGNALATVGKGKAELDGVTLALSQIASKGKISAEEINQLAERVPQIRVAMKDAFGTADTEVLQKAGIGAEEFVTKVVAQLEKLKQVSGGTKNSFENLGDAVTQAAERVGQKLLPSVNQVLPEVEKLVTAAADGVDAFLALPGPIKEVALAVGALTLAAGPVATLLGNLGKLGGVIASAAAYARAHPILIPISIITTAATRDFGDIKKELDPSNLNNAAFTAVTGKSREMETSLRALISTAGGLAGVPSTFQIMAQYAGKAATEVKKLGATVEKASNAIKVSSIAARVAVMDFSKGYGEVASSIISKGSLVYVEGLERVKAGVGRAKDAVFDFIHASDGLGKKLELNSSAFEGLARRSDEYATSLKRAIAEQEKLVANDNVRAMGAATPLGFPTLPTTWSTGDAAKQLGIETESARAKRIAELQRNADILREANRRGDSNVSGNMVIEAEQKLKEAIEGTGRAATISGKVQTKALQQVSTIVTDLSRGIAGIIFEGGKFGDMMQKVAKQAGQAITRELIEGALSKLSKKLLDVGGIFGTVFGGGTGMIKSATGGMGDLGGAAAKTGGLGGVTSAIGGLSGMVTAVASVGSLISGIVGNFQNARMEGTMNQVERNTAAASIHLLHTLEKANQYWPYLESIWQSLIRMETAGGFGGGGGTVNVSMAGAYLMSDAQMGDFADRLARFLKARGI